MAEIRAANTFAENPRDTGGSCPKCESVQHWRPTFAPETDSGTNVYTERLVWRCNFCGFLIETDCADAPAPAR